jgi:hypothetical protein
MRIGAPATADLLRSALSAGSLQLVGNTTVNGEPAVELSLLVPPPSAIGLSYSDTFYLDASSYLPIREISHFQNKQLPGAPPANSGSTEHDFTFLPPTSANLALLQPSIPSGLTQVSAPTTFNVLSCSSLPFSSDSSPASTSATGNSGGPRATQEPRETAKRQAVASQWGTAGPLATRADHLMAHGSWPSDLSLHDRQYLYGTLYLWE